MAGRIGAGAEGEGEGEDAEGVEAEVETYRTATHVMSTAAKVETRIGGVAQVLRQMIPESATGAEETETVGTGEIHGKAAKTTFRAEVERRVGRQMTRAVTMANAAMVEDADEMAIGEGEGAGSRIRTVVGAVSVAVWSLSQLLLHFRLRLRQDHILDFRISEEKGVSEVLGDDWDLCSGREGLHCLQMEFGVRRLTSMKRWFPHCLYILAKV